MRKSSIAGLLLSGLLFSATASFGQAQEEIIKVVGKDKSSLDDYSLVWEPIKESNIAWKKRVWRTVDISGSGNEALRLASVHPSIGDVLVNGLYSGAFKPHGAYTTDRMDNELNEGNIRSLKDQGLNGSQVTSLQIKEDWLFLKEEKKMVVRILAIAPVVKENGKDYPVFWIYYPDARTYLQKQQIASPDMHPNTLDEVFEGRFFSSKIDKVSQPLNSAKTVIE